MMAAAWSEMRLLLGVLGIAVFAAFPVFRRMWIASWRTAHSYPVLGKIIDRNLLKLSMGNACFELTIVFTDDEGVQETIFLPSNHPDAEKMETVMLSVVNRSDLNAKKPLEKPKLLGKDELVQLRKDLNADDSDALQEMEMAEISAIIREFSKSQEQYRSFKNRWKGFLYGFRPECYAERVQYLNPEEHMH